MSTDAPAADLTRPPEETPVGSSRSDPSNSASGGFSLTLETGVGDRVATVKQFFPVDPPDPFNEPLLRGRLQGLSTGLVVVISAFLGWRVLWDRGNGLAWQGGMLFVLGLAHQRLSGSRALSTRSIRFLEVLLFSAFAGFLASQQFEGMREGLARGDPDRLILPVKSAVLVVVCLLFGYCLWIPNTWRSALRVVPILAITPFATELLFHGTVPGVAGLNHQGEATGEAVENATVLAVASLLAVLGCHLMHSLRVEARMAHELNHYRLVQRLGSGGMGEVYLAEHRLLKRPCAVKLIRHDSATDPIERTRFEREVLATARLSHPNTVEVYDYGRTDEGTFYYVMEYLRGLSLEEIAVRHGPMPAGRVIYLLRQICGALAEAHDAGLVHRDVKPANIFASVKGGRRDVAKLLDFGLVKGPALGLTGEATDARRDGMIRGTPLYMAPEQVRADVDVDHRCDIYGMGGVAYRLLTGSPPFDHGSRTQVLSAHAHEPVMPPSFRRSEVPEDLERVILRCLDKSTSQRYQDAHELADALGECQAAADWDAERASQWWQDHEPDAVAPLSPLS